MSKITKIAFLAGVVALGALSTPRVDAANICATVRCAECPTGQRPALHPPDCCRCIPE
ncbi:MAG TPA: hypothetical protein VG477_04160 [Thermoanaerobaculia bacterium]|nr:hypothetical protein [Thermoanaerobaculia bacterium]